MERKRLLSVLAAVTLVMAVPGVAWAQLLGGGDTAKDTEQDGSRSLLDGSGQGSGSNTSRGGSSGGDQAQGDDGGLLGAVVGAVAGDGEDGGGQGSQASGGADKAGAGKAADDTKKKKQQQPQGDVVSAGTSGQSVQPVSGGGASSVIHAHPVASAGPAPGGGSGAAVALPTAVSDLPVPSVAQPTADEIVSLATGAGDPGPQHPPLLLLLTAALVAATMVGWKVAWDQLEGQVG